MTGQELVADLMTPHPVSLDDRCTVTEAARTMRAADIGPILVTRADRLGIVTDRDIVTRVVAEGRDPDAVTLGELATWDPVCVSSDESIETVIQLMRDRAVRRVPVVDEGQLVGVLSLGDLAIDRDPDSALAEISRAAPNN